MNSLDKSVIGVEIARKMFKPKHTPRLVASAQTWAITFTNHSEQVLGKPYDQQKRSFSQFGTANAVAPMSLPENAKRPRFDSPAPAPPRQPCKFCLGNGHLVDLCYKLIAYLKENRTEIDTWCTTRKGISSAPNGGKPKGDKPKGGKSKGGNPKGGHPKVGNRYQPSVVATWRICIYGDPILARDLPANPCLPRKIHILPLTSKWKLMSLKQE
jgi:hypothetical protein